MKKMNISLLAAGAALAFMACSSLEVSNPAEENFPEDWNLAEYVKANPDLRALQIRDQVALLNKVSGVANDDDAFLAEAALVSQIATQYGGFASATIDLTDKDVKAFIVGFNIYGVANEPAVFDTLTLDSNAFELQYASFGKIEGRPYRLCRADETNLVKRGDCQGNPVSDMTTSYLPHSYCSDATGVVRCIDCDASLACPEIAPASSSDATPASSSAAAPASSSDATPASSSETAPASSSETAPASSSDAAPASSSETAPSPESSSSEPAPTPAV